MGHLDPWPLDAPPGAYCIVSGEPSTFGRIVFGEPGHATRFGIWRCTRGAFACTEQGDELMTVLAGYGRINWTGNGAICNLAPGVTLFIRDASRVVWEIPDDLTRFFRP